MEKKPSSRVAIDLLKSNGYALTAVQRPSKIKDPYGWFASQCATQKTLLFSGTSGRHSLPDCWCRSHNACTGFTSLQYPIPILGFCQKCRACSTSFSFHLPYKRYSKRGITNWSHDPVFCDPCGSCYGKTYFTRNGETICGWILLPCYNRVRHGLTYDTQLWSVPLFPIAIVYQPWTHFDPLKLRAKPDPFLIFVVYPAMLGLNENLIWKWCLRVK